MKFRLSLVALFLLAAFYCFWNLDFPSIHTKDENLHVSATQDIFQHGHWFRPSPQGVTYLNKPPFKMWLTIPALALLGESNTAYRTPDAVCGVLLVLLVFVAAYRLFSTLTAAWAAGLSLLASNILLFHHGFRVANQDALLLFLVSLALLFGYRALAPGEEERLRRTNALVSGTLIGLAVLTKSAGALIAFVVLGAFYLLSRSPKDYFRLPPAHAAAFLLPALAVSAAYYVPLFIYTPGAFENAFVFEVRDRVLVGYHNREDYLFYWKELVQNASGLPPVLLAAGLAWGGWQFFRTKSPALLMLLLAALLPPVLYSFIPSRLPWYIFPMLPPAAILAGGACAAAVRAVATVPKKHAYAAALALVVLVAGGYQMTRQLVSNARAVLEPGPKNEINLLADALKAHHAKHPGVRFVVFENFNWRRDEQPYANLVRSFTERIRTYRKLRKTLAEHNEVVVALPESELRDVLALPRPVAGYLKTPPSEERPFALWLLSYSPDFGAGLLSSGSLIISDRGEVVARDREVSVPERQDFAAAR